MTRGTVMFGRDAVKLSVERLFTAYRAVRDKCLGERLFRSYHHARECVQAWRIDYNMHCPHTGLGGLTPNDFATRSGGDHNMNRAS